MILWKTIIKRSAWVPVNTGMSIGTVAVYGLLSRTPKFLSPESRSNMNTPMCMSPTRAKNSIKFFILIYLQIYKRHWKLTLIGSGVVQVVQNGNQNFQNVTALQHEIQKFLKSKIVT